MTTEIIEKDIAHDDEFMAGITEQPLTAEEYKKKKERLLGLIDEIECKIAENEELYNASKSDYLDILKNKLKTHLQKELDSDYEDLKELKDGIKDLEAVKTTIKLFSAISIQYKVWENDLKKYNKELEDLEARSRQLTFADETAAKKRRKERKREINLSDECLED